ncbi:MAG: alpha/beta hydrolase [Xanthomonadales bacterium]|nr:alpha/beta hydrolase [Xanthomonadales bacterium]
MTNNADFPRISLSALADWRARGRVEHFRGHQVFARVHAMPGVVRPWLLLIHGFPTASLDWHPLWAQLSHEFNLLAPDLLGFGFSDKPADIDYTIAMQADLVVHWCNLLGIANAHVIAHDYGVTVAQELLARDLERRVRGDAGLVDSIAFLNGGLFPESHRPRLIQKLLLTALGPLLSRLLSKRSFASSFSAVFGPDTQPTADEIDAFWALLSERQGRRIAHRLMRYVPERHAQRARWVGALVESQVPMRLINGACDPVSGAHLAQRYRELIREPDIVWLDDIGHYPQVEAPARVHASLRAFWLRIGAVNPAD